MSEYTKASFRGLLIPDDRFKAEEISTADGTFTQAGPRPGVPDPQDNTDMVLHSSGDQSAAQDLQILALKGGFPVEGQAGFVWKNSADAGTLYRGGDFPTAIASWQPVTEADTTIAGPVLPMTTRFPHAITLANGKVIVGYNWYNSNHATTENKLQVKVLDNSAYTWGSAVTVASRATFASLTGVDVVYHPSLVELPGGRILLFALYRKSGTTVLAQVDMYYSDDDGATWAAGAVNTLPDGIDCTASSATGYTMNRCRAILHNGQICLVLSGHVGANTTSLSGDEIWQYASDDYGNSFSLVEQWDLGVAAADVNTGASPDLVVAGGFILMVYLSPSGKQSYVLRSGSAYTPFTYDTATRAIPGCESECTTASAGDPGHEYVVIGNVAIWRDDDGAVYTMSRQTGTTGRPIIMGVSRDAGKSWAPAGYDSTNGAADIGSLLNLGDDDTYPLEYSCVAQGGRTLCLHTRAAAHAPATRYDESIGCAYLGGYSTVTMPAVTAFSKETRRVGWDRNWVPFEKPDNVGWTSLVGGAGAATLNAAYLRLQSADASADDAYYRLRPTTVLADGMMALATIKVIAAPDPATDHTVFLELDLGDGSSAHGYKLRAAVGEDKIVWWDEVGSSTLATTSSIDTTDGVQILMAIQETVAGTGKASTWYRTFDVDAHTDDRQWTPVLSNQTMTDTSGTLTGAVYFGALDGATASASSDSYWYGVHIVTQAGNAGEQLAAGQTNPDDLFPKPFRATSMWVNDGVRIAATDGPAWRDDDWSIATRYSYSIDHVYPLQHPSPRIGWRSTGVTQEQIAWRFDGVNQYPVLGMYLDRINFQTGTLAGYDDDSTAWVDIASFDTAVEFYDLPYTRKGDLIIPNVSALHSPGIRYIHANELQDCTVDLGSSKFRKVSSNTAGLWRYATTQYPTLRLTTVDGTEPTTGRMQIWGRRMLMVVSGQAALYSGYRLTIDAQTNSDGYFEIGTMALGPVHYFAEDYSWARSFNTTPNTDLKTYADGTRTSSINGPPRRAVSFGWADAVDAAPMSGFHPFPDYVTASDASGSQAVGLRGAAPLMVRDLAEELNGPHVPVVYIANIPKLVPSTSSVKSVLLNASNKYLLGGDILSKARTEAFSISCWLKRADTTHAAHEYIVEKGGGAAAGYVLIMPSGSNDEIKFSIRDADGDEIGRITNTEPFSDTLWHHLVVTYDGSSARTGINIYVDGLAQGVTNTDDATIAGDTSSTANFKVAGIGSGNWDGRIDEMTIWDSELSLIQVRKLLNQGTPGDPTAHLGQTPQAWWKMGDGDTLPTIVNHGSISSGNLTAQNSPTLSTTVPGPPGELGDGVYQITSRERFLYGRLIDGPEITTVLGEEDEGITGELMKLSAITIEEEV